MYISGSCFPIICPSPSTLRGTDAVCPDLEDKYQFCQYMTVWRLLQLCLRNSVRTNWVLWARTRANIGRMDLFILSVRNAGCTSYSMVISLLKPKREWKLMLELLSLLPLAVFCPGLYSFRRLRDFSTCSVRRGVYGEDISWDDLWLVLGDTFLTSVLPRGIPSGAGCWCRKPGQVQPGHA